MRHETNWDDVVEFRLHDVWRTRAGNSTELFCWKLGMVLTCPSEESDFWEKVEFYEKMFCVQRRAMSVFRSAGPRNAGQPVRLTRTGDQCAINGGVHVSVLNGWPYDSNA